jgi:hypothetical protein
LEIPVEKGNCWNMEASNDTTILYYPVGRAIGFFFFGLILLVATAAMLVIGLIGPFVAFGFVLAVFAIVLGIRALTTRKKYPMSMGADVLTFYRKSGEVRIPIQDIKRIWFNRSGIDKRVSLALADGNVIDIPVLYGLEDLRKKLNKRYGIGYK